MNHFIVKERQYAGTYRNPYRRGGSGMKWGPWKTKSAHDNLPDALAAACVDRGLARRSVFYRGERLSEGNRLLSGRSIEQEMQRLSQEAEERPRHSNNNSGNCV